MPKYTGEIGDRFVKEGQRVEKGDVLFSILSTDHNLQEEQLTRNRMAYINKIERYIKLVQSIKDDTNYFDVTNQDDSLYYTPSLT
jgi:multidrug efflux pump subunit AcrA (membrane-fusion protein)